MDSSTSIISPPSVPLNALLSDQNGPGNGPALTSQLLGGGRDAATVDVGFDGLYKGLSISAQEILDQLNKMLKGKLPGGASELDPTDFTPEKTADRIISGIVGLFGAYSKSNGDLDPEEMVSRFFAAAKKGVEQGYGDASSTLDKLGAFQFDGVKSGIEQTKTYLDDKLAEYEAQIRQSLRLAAAGTEARVATSVSSQVLAQGSAVVAQSSRVDVAA